jgi:hypothetical protein
MRSGTIAIDDDNGTYEGSVVVPGTNELTTGTCSIYNDASGNPAAVVYSGTWQNADGSASGPFALMLDYASPDSFGGYFGVSDATGTYPWCGQRQP